MIKAYLVGIANPYENEDIQVRYRIYKDEALIAEKNIYQGYQKPSVVSHIALLTLLKELKQYCNDEITIIINDAALNEQLRGTSTTKNANALKVAGKVKEKLYKFKSITIQDVSSNREELMKWNDELKI